MAASFLFSIILAGPLVLSELMSGLISGFLLALVAMYGLLAVAFRSYYQPILVLSAIPFGMIGAAMGHVIMGYDLSMMTMFGVVALSGGRGERFVDPGGGDQQASRRRA